MNNLSQECKSQIEKLFPDNPQVKVSTIGTILSYHEAKRQGAEAALTNPTIYQAAGLMTVYEALRFAEWVQYECIRYDGDWVIGGKLYTTTEQLLTIFRQQKEMK